MKYLLIYSVIFATTFVRAQDSLYRLFDEYAIAGNVTCWTDQNTNLRFGGGFGVYHLFYKDKWINPIVGLEYELIHQYKKSMYTTEFDEFKRVTYSISSISIPVGVRFQTHGTKRFFAEVGGFADLILNSRETGTALVYDYDQGKEVEQEVTRRVKLYDSFGVYLAGGVILPLKNRFSLLIKPEVKWGTKFYSSGVNQIFNQYVGLMVGLHIDGKYIHLK